MFRSICCWLACGVLASSSALAAQRVILQGNGKLAIVKADGSTEWEMNWGGIHDIHLAKNGHIFVQQGAAKVAEIDPATKQVVWSYDSATQNGNAGKKVEIHAFQPLDKGRLMIVESGPARIIEVSRREAAEGNQAEGQSSPSAHRHAVGSKTDDRQLPRLPRGRRLCA